MRTRVVPSDRRRSIAIVALVCGLGAAPVSAQRPATRAVPAAAAAAAPTQDAGPTADTFAGLTVRNIGPALTSGRIVGLAVHPADPAVVYVAAASGGVWKTDNGGASWQPIFDGQGSYSIGGDRPRPDEPEHRLGRHRREQQPAQRRLRRRRLQVDRRRDARGRRWGSSTRSTSGASLVDPRDSRRRVRRGAGTALGPRRRPRPLQDHRRRQDLEPGAVDQRAHGRDRPRDRPARSGRARRARATSAGGTSSR